MTSAPEPPTIVEHELALHRRIGELEQIIMRLQGSEQCFRELFERSPDAIYVEDVADNVLDANPAACRLHDLPRDQLIGKHVMELVPLDKREADALNGYSARGGSNVGWAWHRPGRHHHPQHAAKRHRRCAHTRTMRSV